VHGAYQLDPVRPGPVEEQVSADHPGARIRRDLRAGSAHERGLAEPRARLLDSLEKADRRARIVGRDMIADRREVGLRLWAYTNGLNS
jgi:hypothetical protein